MNGEASRAPGTRRARSWFVLRQAVRLLRGDRSRLCVLLLGALAAAVPAVAICGAFAAAGILPQESYRPWGYWALFIVVWLVADAVAAALSVVLVAMAQARLDGAPMTVRDALAFAVRRRSALLGWVLLSGVCDLGLGGMVASIRFRGEQPRWLAESTWSVASWFAVPVMAAEDAGPLTATRRSVAIHHARWGRWERPMLRVPAFLDLWIGAAAGLVAYRSLAGAHGGHALAAAADAGLLAVAIVLRCAVRQLFALLFYRAELGEPVPGPAPEQLDALVRHWRVRPAGVGRFDDIG
jgi:Family of unknown function (DUF6159)